MNTIPLESLLHSVIEWYKKVYSSTAALGCNPHFESIEMVLERRESYIASAAELVARLDAEFPLWRTAQESSVQLLRQELHALIHNTIQSDALVEKLLERRKAEVKKQLSVIGTTARATKGYITSKSLVMSA